MKYAPGRRGGKEMPQHPLLAPNLLLCSPSQGRPQHWSWTRGCPEKSSQSYQPCIPPGRGSGRPDPGSGRLRPRIWEAQTRAQCSAPGELRGSSRVGFVHQPLQTLPFTQGPLKLMKRLSGMSGGLGLSPRCAELDPHPLTQQHCSRSTQRSPG